MTESHAVVIGASIGGVLAARALTDHFAQVTLLDRDELPADAVERKGAAQAYHSHGLMVRGREIFEELFPGITDELVAQGGILADMQRQVVFYNDGLQVCPARSDLIVLAASRALLETQLRSRLAALPGVTIRERSEVIGLDTTGDRVTGVRMQPSGSSDVESIAADLVVDASGRSNRSLAWLTELGYDAPAEVVLRSGITYATQQWHREPTDYRITIGIPLSPTFPRGAVAIAAEGDRWICTAIGTSDVTVPSRTEEFTAFVETLQVPDLATMISMSKPVSDVVKMHMPTSTWRRFDQLKRFPERYVVLGDALCNLNPTYGQGMTVVAAEALVLRDCVATGLDRIGPRFFAAAKGLVALAWQMQASGDLRFPWVEGERTRAIRIMSRYMDRLSVAASQDAKVAYAFLRVVNMISKPQTLFAPDVALRVLRPRRVS